MKTTGLALSVSPLRSQFVLFVHRAPVSALRKYGIPPLAASATNRLPVSTP